MIFSFKTETFVYAFDEMGRVTELTDLRSGENRAAEDSYAFCLPDAVLGGDGSVSVARSGKRYPDRVTERDGAVCVSFGELSFSVSLSPREDHIRMRIEKIEPENAAFGTFLFGGARMRRGEENDFYACAVTRSLRVNPAELPGDAEWVGCIAYGALSPLGGEGAICAAPADRIREAILHATDDVGADEIIKNPLGGANAAAADGVYDDYLIAVTDTVPESADWLMEMRRFGALQRDFHQGIEYRQGDYRFRPDRYPGGAADFRRTVTDVLHQNGMKAGLHIYAGMLDPESRFVSPIPSRDLSVLKTYTLGAALDAEAAELRILEPSEQVALYQWAGGGENVRCLRIDDEIVSFETVKDGMLCGVRRGLFGTTASPHAVGSTLFHLRCCYRYFLAAPGSPLFETLAAETARVYNEAGFDMLYFDGLECIGAAVDGTRSGVCDWYYEALFVRDVLKALERPALVEYSIFHTALWAGRSRAGAFDTPCRGYRYFIDRHCAYNEENVHRRLLPSQLGWYQIYPPVWELERDIAPGWSAEYPFTDDVDYLAAKLIAYDSGWSGLSVDPELLSRFPRHDELLERLKAYAPLRRPGAVPQAVKSLLRRPGDAFRIAEDGKETKLLRCDRLHVFPGLGGEAVCVNNPFFDQRPRLRILARYCAGEGKEELPLYRFEKEQPIGETPFRVSLGDGEPVDLTGREALTLEVYGNGREGYLYLRVYGSPRGGTGVEEHLVRTDFTGWRQISLCGSDSDLCGRFAFPMMTAGERPRLLSPYALYREMLNRHAVTAIEIHTAGDVSGVRLGEVRAAPFTGGTVKDPSVSVGGETVTFRCGLEAGEYLEYCPGEPFARQYDVYGYRADVPAEGRVGVLPHGESTVTADGVFAGDRRLCVHLLVDGETVWHTPGTGDR